MKRVKKEFRGQVLKVRIPGMGMVTINTDDIKGDKSFYIQNGLGYLFEDIKLEADKETIKEEVIDLPIDEEIVEEEKPEPVKKNKGGRPRNK